MANALARTYSTRRRALAEALKNLFQDKINGQSPMRNNVAQVNTRLTFWDEVQDFPTIQIGMGSETRDYDGGGFRFRFIRATIRCYVHSNDDVIEALESLLEDVETVLEDNDPFTYYDSTGASHTTAQSTILAVDTDEGVLEPLGVGEITVEIRY